MSLDHIPTIAYSLAVTEYDNVYENFDRSKNSFNNESFEHKINHKCFIVPMLLLHFLLIYFLRAPCWFVVVVAVTTTATMLPCHKLHP